MQKRKDRLFSLYADAKRSQIVESVNDTNVLDKRQKDDKFVVLKIDKFCSKKIFIFKLRNVFLKAKTKNAQF